MSTVVNDEQAREQYRKQHDVRVVPTEMEGTGIDGQASGTYGFTYSPMGASPIFGQRKVQNFEIHKAINGQKYVLGYVSQAEVEAVAKKTAADLKLYPDPFEQSTEFVCLSFEDIALRPQHSGLPGSPASLHFEP